MKVCPIQKYGMAPVLTHYAETGQVLGKGSHDLEGYTLPDKGYFGPGEMPVFEPSFFSEMPHGTAEAWALEQLRHKFAEAGNKITDDMIQDFKKAVLKSMDKNPDVIMEILEV